MGVVRNNNTWLFDSSGNGVYGTGDLSYVFGKAGDVYVTGDWNTDGRDRDWGSPEQQHLVVRRIREW